MTAFKKFCTTSSCFDLSKKSLPKNQINGLALGENINFPVVGETIKVIDRSGATPVVSNLIVTKENQSEANFKFMEYQRISCFEGDGTKNIYFFPYLKVKGTRPEWTPVDSTIGDAFEAETDRYEVTTEYMFQNMLANQCALAEIKKRGSKLSVVEFLDNGINVLNFGNSETKYQNKLIVNGVALSGDGQGATGKFSIMHRGDELPCFNQVPDAYADTFEKLVREDLNTLVFLKTPTVETGLTVLDCSGRNECVKRKATVGTAFTFQFEIAEKALASCVTYSIRVCKGNKTVSLLDFSPALAAAITIDPNTGLVSAPTGIPVGDYTLEVVASNACCSNGSMCINIVSA